MSVAERAVTAEMRLLSWTARVRGARRVMGEAEARKRLQTRAKTKVGKSIAGMRSKDLKKEGKWVACTGETKRREKRQRRLAF